MKRITNLPSYLLLAATVVLMLARCGKGDETIEPPEPSTSYLTVTQSLPETPFSAEGGTQTIVFSTDKPWSVSFESSSIPSQWYDVTQHKGDAGDKNSIEVLISPNPDKTTRNVTLVLRTTSHEERIEVRQSGDHPIIIGETHYEFASTSHILTVNVKPDALYTVSIKDGKDWITDNGEKDNKHTFTISRNTLDKERGGTIIFQDDTSELFDEITLVQAAWEDIEHNALVSFYNEAGGGGWTRNDNWCSDKPFGEWYGVETDNEGNVTALRLANNNLTGTVSWEISGLSMLRHLDLSWNALSGDLSKEEGSDVVDCFDGMAQVETIDISHNSFTGKFLPCDGQKLIQLKHLNLSFNRFSGFAFPFPWKPMFENGRSVDIVTNNNYLFDSDVPDFIQDHPDWSRLALQCIRQYLDHGGIDYTKDIILPDFTFTDLRDGSKKSIRELYTSKTMTMILAWDPTQEDSKTFMETTVRRFHTLYNGQGFEVVAITPEGEKYKQAAEQYLQTHNVPYPVVTDYADNQGRRAILPCDPYPSYFLVDKNGKFLKDMFTGQLSSGRLPGEPYYIDIIKYPFLHTNDLCGVFNAVFGHSQYRSKDFSMDKKYETLQHATKGKGIDIVLIGDAYTDVDIETGLYRQVMEYAMEAFFLIEPTKSYREYFNIHMIYAVSKNAHIDRSGDNTALGTRVVDKEFDCYTATLRLPDYCRVIGKPIHAVGTFVNATNGGVAYLENPIYGPSYAFTGLFLGGIRSMYRNTFIHETVGHAFGLLDDEYNTTYDGISQGEIPESEKQILKSHQEKGLFLNVSLTNDPKKVYWSHLIGHLRYPYVDIYEGAAYYSKGVWKSEPNTEMSSSSTLYFNAICRQLIVKRTMELADEEFTIEKFMAKDIYEPKPFPYSITPTQQQINEYKTNHQPPIVME